MELVKIKDLPEGIYGPIPNRIKPLLKVDTDPKYGHMERQTVILLAVKLFINGKVFDNEQVVRDHLLNELNELYPINLQYLLLRFKNVNDEVSLPSIKRMAGLGYLSDDEFKYFINNEPYIFKAVANLGILFERLVVKGVNDDS